MWGYIESQQNPIAMSGGHAPPQVIEGVATKPSLLHLETGTKISVNNTKSVVVDYKSGGSSHSVRLVSLDTAEEADQYLLRLAHKLQALNLSDPELSLISHPDEQ